MKSTFHQVPNMRGKKEFYYSCGCCWAINKKSEYAALLAEREIRDAVSTTGLGLRQGGLLPPPDLVARS